MSLSTDSMTSAIFRDLTDSKNLEAILENFPFISEKLLALQNEMDSIYQKILETGDIKKLIEFKKTFPKTSQIFDQKIEENALQKLKKEAELYPAVQVLAAQLTILRDQWLKNVDSEKKVEEKEEKTGKFLRFSDQKVEEAGENKQIEDDANEKVQSETSSISLFRGQPLKNESIVKLSQKITIVTNEAAVEDKLSISEVEKAENDQSEKNIQVETSADISNSAKTSDFKLIMTTIEGLGKLSLKYQAEIENVQNEINGLKTADKILSKDQSNDPNYFLPVCQELKEKIEILKNRRDTVQTLIENLKTKLIN